MSRTGRRPERRTVRQGERLRARRPEGGTGRGLPLALGGIGALLLAAVPAGPAVAQESGDEAPGPRPYATAPDAQPVEGSASTADAPRIEAGSLYTDALEPGDEVYYRVVLDDVSDYYLSAVAAPEAGTKVASNDGISLRLHTTGGDTCGPSQDRTFQSDGAVRPIAASEFRVIDRDGSCQTTDTYLLKLTRQSDPTSSPAAWPVELRVMAEPAVLGGELSAPPPARWVTEENLPTPPTGDSRTIRGGTGFNDAQPIEEGVWRDDIAPGATLFYRVPVDWHQQLVVSAELTNAAVADAGGTVFDAFTVEAYTPYRSLAHRTESTSYDGGLKKQQLVTPPVGYDHRHGADDRYAERTRVAGWHYLAVHLHADVAELIEAADVGVTLRVSLAGEISPGPEYDGDLAAAGFGVSEREREQAREGKSDEALAGEKSDTKELMGYAGIGAGVTLLLVLAGWHLTARRRARA